MIAPHTAGGSSAATYLSYVSPLVLRRLRRPEPVTTAECERVSGTVALIDVERFSVFAERMAARGGEGVELLAARINGTFALMVEAIERYGGIAHAFPGDSVIAFWQAEGRSAEDAAMLAVRCTLELIESHRDSELPLKAGLAAGNMTLTQVGGIDGRLQLLLSGAPLDEMGRAEERSSRGRLIVAESAWKLLAPHAVASVDADGYFELKSLRSAPPAAKAPPPQNHENDAGLVERARAYLPSALLRQLDAGHTAWLGEFREVTAIFLEIRPTGLGDPFSAVQPAFREAQRVLFRHGGDIMRFAHDDKGLAVLAVFGLPPQSSEDLAVRAVTAALEIHQRCPQLQFQCRAGIASGRVFCGTLGAPGRREFSVVGSTANLAARLMQSLEGGVLCDATTAGFAAPVCRFTSAGRLRPKGFPDSIEVFRAAGTEGARRSAAPAQAIEIFELVGRERERERLRVWVDHLHERRGALAVVQGEAGVGKSVLVRHAADRARDAGTEVIRVACEAVQSSSTYAAWATVLSALLRLDSISGNDATSVSDARIAQLRGKVEAAGAQIEFAPLVARLLGMELDDSETTRDIDGAARADNLLALMTRLLGYLITERRRDGDALLLVLEDAHWLDPSSWELLAVLTRQPDTVPIAVLLSLRAEAAPVGAHWDAVAATGEAERIQVSALSKAETGEFSRRLLRASGLSQQLSTLVYERTRGNPFFCEQLLSALSESGMIGVEEGVASLRLRNPEQAESMVPRSVAAVVTSRLDRLPAPVQLTLKTASVLGARFRLDALRAIHPMGIDDETLLSHLLDATELGLVDRDATDGSHRFRHAITCDVAYGLLLVSQKRQLHRDAAEHLSSDGDSAAVQSVLFYHWRRSGDEARALRHVDHAGAEAMRNGNYYAVTELYGYALQTLASNAELLPPLGDDSKPPREALWSGHLGAAQVAIGLHVAARSNLELCLETLRRAAPANIVGLALAVVHETFRQLLYRAWPSRYAGRHAREAARLALAADTYEHLGYVYYSAGETLRGLHAALRILNLSELAGLPALTARSCAMMSLTAGVLGFSRIASVYDRRAVRIARETNDGLVHAYVGWVTGLRAAGEADWDLVAMRVEAALRVAEQAGNRRTVVDCLQTLAWPSYVRGDFARSAELADAQLAIARESNNRLWEAWGRNGLAEAEVMTGDYEAAIRNSERSLDVLTEESDKAEEIRATGLLAVSLLRHGRGDEASSVARRGLDLMATVQITNIGMYEGFAGVCEVMVATSEEKFARSRSVPSTLERDTRRAIAAFERFRRAFRIAGPRLHSLRARVAMLNGAAPLALRQIDGALRSADELRMPHEKGLALLTAARCEGYEPVVRRRRAEEAVGILRPSEALRQAKAILEARLP